MKSIQYTLTAAAIALAASACGDFGDINYNPDKLSQAETSYLLLRAEMYAPFFSINDTYNPWPQIRPGYISEPRNFQFTALPLSQCLFNLGNLNRRALGNLEEIIRITKGDNERAMASLGGGAASQLALAETLRAYYYMHITDALGMVPYSEAFNSDKLTPKYDTMQEIYSDLDARLVEAYKNFNEAESFNAMYDVIYKGDISLWKKLNATLRMLMAIKLADVDPATGKARFARAYADGGLESDGTSALGDGDTFAFPYINENDNANLLYSNIIVSGRKDFSPSNNYIDALLEHNDPRIVTIATTVKGEFKGAIFGLQNKEKVIYSEFTEKYYGQNTPQEVISAAHLRLVQAEAALYGWINADPAKLYAEGVTLSFANFGVSDDLSLKGINLDVAEKLRANINVVAYLKQPAVALTGDKASDLKKIAMQRWINNYLKDGVEAWSDMRRLDWPEIKIGGDAELKVMPVRMLYHTDDYDANRKMYDEAVATQPDKVTTRLWWDTK